jgi:addiction module RelE/StbE family toxin
MNVVWTDPAEEDRDRIVLFIAQDNPQPAFKMDDLFTAAADSLATLPSRAKVGRVLGTRELIVHKNYILVYGIDEDADTVYIKAVIHSLRQWPPAADNE